MKFTIYQESRQGGRKNNEDCVAHSYSRDALLMVIADGMGGHHYGEVASQIAVQTLIKAFQREAHPVLEDPFSFLQKNFDNAHYAILDYAENHRMDDAPRTTIVACVIQDSIAYWAHAGDSRLYLIRRNRVISQTRDHSQVRYMLDEGLISNTQAKKHPDRNKIYSCLGSKVIPEVEFSRKTPLESGDLVMLCTDGLWSVVNNDILVRLLKSQELMQSVPRLMQDAEKLGGPGRDNLSIIIARWEENYAEDSLSSISTHGMDQNEVSATLDDFGRSPYHKSDLTDEEIEQAILEINAAIEKYSSNP